MSKKEQPKEKWNAQTWESNISSKQKKNIEKKFLSKT